MEKNFIRIKIGIGGALLLLCLFLVPATVFADGNISSAPLPSLEKIEILISDGPEVLETLSAIARDEALEAWTKQRTGAKYFGNITYGYSNEPIFDTSSDKKRYNQLSLSAGLNFPLLGSLQKEKIGKIETETATMESKHRSNMLLLNNLVALRKAYTTLWIEQQKEEIARRFLTTEAETTHILQERQAQGLVLPVDQLEFLSVYQDVKRDIAASKLRQTRALRIISLVTGRKWEVTEKLKAPSLPRVDGKKIDLTIHPDVVFQNNLVSQYEKLLAEKKRIDREGNLAVGSTVARDFPGATGNGAYITFSTTGPVKGIGSKDQAKLAAANDLNRVKQEEIFIRLKLDGQVEEALAMAAYSASDVSARTAHLIVTAESIREKMLRRTVLPGDVFEQLQRSKSQYYGTALTMLDHEELFLQSEIDIISYVYPRGLVSESTERVLPINENDPVRNKLLAPSWLNSNKIQDNMSVPLDFSNIRDLKIPLMPSESLEKKSANPIKKRSAVFLEKVNAAVYVWNAQPFLQSDTRTVALNQISDAGFSRMLISFTNKQITALLSPKGKDDLDALIGAAKSRGIRIDLMLGDPTWAEAEHRGELLALIQQLRKFDFDGLHLDIEPDSLPNASTRQPELLADLAATIKAVKEITTLPISISIHPRYLEGELGVIARQKLLTLGLEEVVVMIYSNNPNAVAKRMSAIMTSNPNVTFSLAQSVEKNIPSPERYAHFTQQEFKDAMHILEDNLVMYKLNGIFIQSWEDYKKGDAK